MSVFLALLGKELRALFYSPIAYIVIGVFLALMGYSFTITLFNNKYATLIHIFFQSAGLLLLIVPVITMRLFAEERKAGTLELLLAPAARDGLDGVPTDASAIIAAVEAAFGAYDLCVTQAGAATPEEVRASGSTWARRLGPDRGAVLVRLARR